MTDTKPVAKSLHTLTVIQQVARLHTGSTPEQRVEFAMETLGLAGRPDPYGLAAAALKQLTAN